MTVENTIAECIDIIEESFNGEVIFDTPVIVKSSCYGASAKDNRLALMDPEGNWHEIDATQANVQYVINSLSQRLKVMLHVGA